MKRIYYLFLTLFVGFLIIPADVFAVSWSKKTAPLMTQWSENIDPSNVWPEYPRPQMERDEWLNLNGVWEFEKVDTYDSYNPSLVFTQGILVPFPPESALSGIMDSDHLENTKKVFVYRRTFELPVSYRNKTVLLHFGAVDWDCTVYINGTEVGNHKGGYDPFYFNITEALLPGVEQEIVVRVFDPGSNGGQPSGKQSIGAGGIYYTSVSGIWQTVWLEPVDPQHIESLTIVPDVDREEIILSWDVSTPEGVTVDVKIYDGNTLVASREGISPSDVERISLPGAKLWSPDTPFLYDLEIELKKGTETADRISSYFGMRKISKGMVNGFPAFLLNNKPLFQYGVLDQGWWPDGLYTAPCDEALQFDLIKTKEMGFNMTRKHVKTEPARWYYHCDRLGLLVWQDIPNTPQWIADGDLGKQAFLQENFYREIPNIMNALKNYPSIVSWVIFNEGWGQDASNLDIHTRNGVRVAQQQDNTRLINAVSGWVDFEVGDVIDAHNYPNPALHTNPVKERVSVCGEYGGITLFVDGHSWKGSGHEYVSVENSEELKNLFLQYVEQVQGLQQNGIWGAVYTQITDVEEEVNGLITYDRKEVKVTDEHISEIKAAIEKTLHVRTVPVLPAGDVDVRSTWKYSFTNPGSGWYTEAFDDAEWKEGLAGFGAGDPPGSNIRTPWTGSEIYLRKHFTLEDVTAEELPDLRLWVYHDEDCEVYLNGILAVQASGYVTQYTLFDIAPAALQALRINGENLIAVKCRDNYGGKFIDAGLTMNKSALDLPVSEIPVLPAEELPVPQDSVYLMSYFKGSEQRLFYAYSEDGLIWNDINLSEPVFNAYDDGIAVRDPYMKRVTHNGETKFHLVHTMGWDNPAIFHWESDDLITWKAANGGTTTEDGKIYVMDGKNGNAQAVNAWAPEFTYVPDEGLFYIYWASKVEGKYDIHHYCTTSDWLTFSPSKVLFDPGFATIDLSILEYRGVYYGFYKDERWGQKKTRLATTRSLNPDIEPFMGTEEVLTGGYTIEHEGPEIYRAIGQDKWFFYWDKFNWDQGVSYAYSTDPSMHKWYMVPDSLVKNPSSVKHGSVEIISKQELDKLNKRYDERTVLLPTAEEEPQEWKYTTVAQYPGWYRDNWDDASWETGLSGFGGGGDVPNSFINTLWLTSSIYLRKRFYVGTLTDIEIENLCLRIYHDDDVDVYINGVQALSVIGHTGSYTRKEIRDAAKRAIIQNGENLIAVRCTDTGGVRYIDVGLQTSPYSLTPPTDDIPVEREKEVKLIYQDKDQMLYLTGFTSLQDFELIIFDSLGRVSYKEEAKENVLLSFLSRGMYIAKCYNKKGSISYTEKFLKSN